LNAPEGHPAGSTPGLPTLVHRLLVTAGESGQRRTLVLSGTQDWTAAAAHAATTHGGEGPAVWLSDRPLHPAARPLATATQLLGGECALLVYDAWSGFDPDGFGAATGTLRGGGLLILLCPPLTDWPALPDPQAARIAPWPLDATAVAGRFIARLVRVLRDQPGLHVLVEGQVDLTSGAPAPTPHAVPHRGLTYKDHPDPAQPATPDQAHAIESILRHARGRPHRPLVLTAHRGRGKSAALGIAAARLLGQADADAHGPRLVLVTAPRRAACDALFAHAGHAWPAAHPDGSGLRAGGLAIRFEAPDALCQGHPAADLLLVDEAAGIPAPLLARLLDLYPRVIFATTVHGYEGTGRGFDLRFRATLDRRTPHWRGLTLETPIRWAPDDPLEALVFRALLLDAAPPTAETAKAIDLADLDHHPSHRTSREVVGPHSGPNGSRPDRRVRCADRTPLTEVMIKANLADCRVERLDREALAADDHTLGQVFGLLVLAHYQTRPFDLRLLLDAPGVRVLVLRPGGQVIATLIAVAEGGMTDPDLLRAVYDGRRRPRGHLLPLTLSAHGGLLDAPRLRYLRVIRIAVHPTLNRRGLGRRLLRGLFREARRDGIDLLGTSFGATPDLIAFWSGCGYRPVQIGTSRNAASGEHALVMLRPTSARGWAFSASARTRLAQRLQVLLPGPLRRLDPAVALALIAALGDGQEWSGHPPILDPLERLELESFATGHRTLEAALPALASLTYRRLGTALRTGRLDPTEAAPLIAAAGQLRPVGELAEVFDARGREAVIEALRRTVGRLLNTRSC
jgi:tRNA(Met) cytidine acetyltransferase